MNRSFYYTLALWILFAAPGIFAIPSQTEWFVAGTQAAADGDDNNPGTAERPLASVQRAIRLIKTAFANEPFETAVINIQGAVTNYGDGAEIFGMITVQGDGPAVILRGSGTGAILDAGGRGRVLFIGGGNRVTLENITLTGGKESTGAGVYVSNSSLVMGNGVVIRDNEAGFGGGDLR